MEYYNDTFRDRFRELRKEKNLTQGEIAKELGVSKASVAMWETGKRTPPLKTLHEIAQYFDCRLDYLLGTSDDPWTTYGEYTDAKTFLKEKAEYEEADDTYNASEYYKSVLKKFVTLDRFGKSLILKVMDEEISRCTLQNTLEKDTSWLQITVRVNPNKRTKAKEKETIENVGVDMDEYWEWMHKREEAMSDD